jgi:hypothetical protein
MKRTLHLSIVFVLTIGTGLGLTYNQSSETAKDDSQTAKATATQKSRTYIRTETFPRPPYSGATYYIYERDNEVICTKLEVCNKFDQCDVTYKKGRYKDDLDIQTGDPYGKTEPILIAPNKLKKHACLTKFKLVS